MLNSHELMCCVKLCFKRGDTIAMRGHDFVLDYAYGQSCNGKIVNESSLMDICVNGRPETFTCLPWANGVVTFARCAGHCIISGPFTGCSMVAFKVKEAVEAGGGNDRLSRGFYAAHVSDRSEAQQAWNNFVANNKDNVDILFKIDPHLAYNDFRAKDWNSEEYEGIHAYCIMHPAADMLCPVILYRMKDKSAEERYYVADIRIWTI